MTADSGSFLVGTGYAVLTFKRRASRLSGARRRFQRYFRGRRRWRKTSSRKCLSGNHGRISRSRNAIIGPPHERGVIGTRAPAPVHEPAYSCCRDCERKGSRVSRTGRPGAALGDDRLDTLDRQLSPQAQPISQTDDRAARFGSRDGKLGVKPQGLPASDDSGRPHCATSGIVVPVVGRVSFSDSVISAQSMHGISTDTACDTPLEQWVVEK